MQGQKNSSKNSYHERSKFQTQTFANFETTVLMSLCMMSSYSSVSHHYFHIQAPKTTVYPEEPLPINIYRLENKENAESTSVVPIC